MDLNCIFNVTLNKIITKPSKRLLSAFTRYWTQTRACNSETYLMRILSILSYLKYRFSHEELF